jgi:pimeloyl-ACP methyl ester carboxylesterase
VKPPLQFSHANGFPAPCYRVFLDALAERFDVRHVDRFGHDPRFPVTDGWRFLAEELIEDIERRGAPVIGVGHSLGGYLSVIAAARRPDLFRAVILLDAPILSRFQGSALAFAKGIGLIDRVTLAGTTRGRRREWPSAEAALRHFRGKRLFRDFDPRCLDDYIRFGTVARDDGVGLAFDTATEYAIYRTLPHDIARAARRLAVPAGLVVGDRSDLMQRVSLRTSRANFAIVTIEGGHLFPFERPAAAAGSVIEMASRLAVL